MRVMHVLLDSEAPGLAEKVISLPRDQWRSILVRACLMIASQTHGLSLPILELLEKLRVQNLLSLADIVRAGTQAQAADSKYFELQSEAAPGALKWFSEARLLTAIAIGFDDRRSDSSPEALYELTKASDNPAQLLRTVQSDVESALQK